MKQIKFIIILILLTQTLEAQKTVVNEFSAIDKKSLELPVSMTTTTKDISTYITTNFKTDKERIRAIFIWVAANIQYDIDNMFALNFYEKREDKIAKALNTRKGICENYAALFNEICLNSGIKSFVIEGYTKQNGFADYIPHAWCSALIEGSWFMFDPTWGSGYISNGKFYKKINNGYFKANPAALIKSHMPFDMLWQFLNYPVTNQEFYERKTIQNKSKSFFNYIDSLKIYESQKNIEQLIASARRIEKNGVKNSLIYDRLQHIKLAIENIKIETENDRQNKAVNLYNAAAVDYNNAINEFNIFIQYRNKQFMPIKSDVEIQKMIDTVTTEFSEAKTKLSQITNPDANTISLILQLNKSIEENLIHVKEQQQWLTLYFSKGKAKRKSMFFEKKITWFGIPIN